MTRNSPDLASPELVVLSHLRWSWVWQRPQHLISRFARDRATWIIEEPMVADVARPEMSWHREGPVCVGRLLVPGPQRHIGFDAPEAAALPSLVAAAADGQVPMVWLYTPLALPIAHALHPDFLVYDVMDDLASFRGASPHLRVAQTAALDIADIVFTGGRSLYAGVVGRRSEHTHLFPSGVEPEHFASAKAMRTSHERPVAGYVGVIDERLDLELIAEVADELPDWDVHIVGPIAKIEREELPGRPNLSFPGPVDYRHLPKALAGFDVALMPFALNDATRSISPTKTLEYMAAGLPIVSTKVPDVVADFSDVVLLADDVVDFAHHCRAALREAGTDAWEQRIAPIVERHRWDCIAGNMSDLIDARREELERSELSLPGGHGDGLRRSA
jgi:glycosyltransferase involved in cell wall biosynthesis